jgi:tetratricopeptide (TPR) repeat protein
MAHVNLANEALRSGQERFEAAGKYARQAIQLRPDRVAGYTLLAATFASQGKIAEAEAVLQEAEKNVGDDLTPYYNTARILLKRSEHLDKAETWLRKYLSQEPEGNAPSHAMARQQLGLVLEKLGKRKT